MPYTYAATPTPTRVRARAKLGAPSHTSHPPPTATSGMAKSFMPKPVTSRRVARRVRPSRRVSNRGRRRTPAHATAAPATIAATAGQGALPRVRGGAPRRRRPTGGPGRRRPWYEGSRRRRSLGRRTSWLLPPHAVGDRAPHGELAEEGTEDEEGDADGADGVAGHA